MRRKFRDNAVKPSPCAWVLTHRLEHRHKPHIGGSVAALTDQPLGIQVRAVATSAVVVPSVRVGAVPRESLNWPYLFARPRALLGAVHHHGAVNFPLVGDVIQRLFTQTRQTRSVFPLTPIFSICSSGSCVMRPAPGQKAQYRSFGFLSFGAFGTHLTRAGGASSRISHHGIPVSGLFGALGIM